MINHLDKDKIAKDVAALAPVLLRALESLAVAARHLHPPNFAELVPLVKAEISELQEARRVMSEQAWPADLAFYQQQLVQSTDFALQAIHGIEKAALQNSDVMQAYKSLRKYTHAVEALYPLCEMLRTVSKYFLEPQCRNDDALLDALANADASRETVGLMHASNDRDQRGGLSIYVPEYYDAEKKWPLVIALHGGSGHGADFLWTWLREARSRGCIVLSPTSIGRTWSLQGEDVDAATLLRIVQGSCEQWNIDPRRILLTGMSDGATYTLLNGLPEQTPYTHLAPISGTFHPMLLEGMGSIKQRKIYLVHGALDWMFPVDSARLTAECLTAAGAEVNYRELEDLSHTYPREVNSEIMDWFLK